MSEPDPRFDELVAVYLDGDLAEDEREELMAILGADPRVREELRRQLRVSGALARLRPERSDENFVRTVLPHLGCVAGESADEFTGRVMTSIRFTRRRRMALAMAAAIALLGTFAGLLVRGDAGVATLYTAGSEEGKKVRASDRFELSEGISRLEFGNGAVVAVEAPAALTVSSADEIILDHGRLNAWCPESAHGFQVTTVSATLTDLGTSFGVSADKNGTADFVVLDGQVEIVRDGEKRTLKKGAALRAVRQQGFSELAYEPKPFHLTWPVASGIRSTRGEVIPAPPGTPEELALMENDDHILVIPERRDFIPRGPIRCDITAPGVYEGEAIVGSQRLEPKRKRKVRSYLLRYNPVAVPGKRKLKRIQGTVTFDRPVLAIITSSQKLNRTDTLLSKAPLPPSSAVEPRTRGLESEQRPRPSDRVRLSKNRRTVSVLFFAGESVDEIRAITADN
ncbi:FecR domain-containing protein [Luteolibacter marinus]|uniref:FecR domain-containing protein n=1 Tax=Luteolibacter marinus TaxID=2776705 RepID=UPI001868A4CB|nr:FecR domain-containing protein [Luteolibacter marinus]